MFIFMQQICVSLSAGNTFSKLKWEYIKYPDANVNKFSMGVSMKFIVFWIYIKIWTRYVPNMKTFLVYHWKQNKGWK